MNTTVIKPQELAKLRREVQQFDLIDVRTPVEYREVHVKFARNVPLDQLDPAAVIRARNGSANEPLYVICRSGKIGHLKSDNRMGRCFLTREEQRDRRTGLPALREKRRRPLRQNGA